MKYKIKLDLLVNFGLCILSFAEKKHESFSITTSNAIQLLYGIKSRKGLKYFAFFNLNSIPVVSYEQLGPQYFYLVVYLVGHCTSSSKKKKQIVMQQNFKQQT